MRFAYPLLALICSLASVGAAPVQGLRPFAVEKEVSQVQAKIISDPSPITALDQVASDHMNALDSREFKFTFTHGRILAATAILAAETFGYAFNINRVLMNYYHPKAAPAALKKRSEMEAVDLEKRLDVGWWTGVLTHVTRAFALLSLPLVWSNVQLAPDLHPHNAPRAIQDSPAMGLDHPDLNELIKSLRARGLGEVKVLDARGLDPLIKADRIFGFGGAFLSVLSFPFQVALYQKAVEDYKTKYHIH
ncbi:hypothetical protein OC845_002135 [Tilletia horrida]|nr:hypothetical protein OC845_002135 [Tilletia horrida]